MFTLSLEIAEIMFDPKTKQIVDVFFRKDIKFKCQRCAVFCCRLGGPKLNVKDLQRLEKAGYKLEIYVDNTKKKKSDNERFLKEKEDGSCIFLKHNVESKNYTCTIYEFRPSVCRFYPFEFLSTDHSTGVLRIIPCCNGLNASDEELVDRKFIEENLFESIIDSIESYLGNLNVRDRLV